MPSRSNFLQSKDRFLTEPARPHDHLPDVSYIRARDGTRRSNLSPTAPSPVLVDEEEHTIDRILKIEISGLLSVRALHSVYFSIPFVKETAILCFLI